MFRWILMLGKVFGSNHRTEKARTSSRQKPRQPRPTFKPCLQDLEDRITPAPLLVTNTSNDPNMTGSLPYEVRIAQTGDTIGFAQSLSGSTINLDAQLELGANGVTDLTIDASNVYVTIDGQDDTRIFLVDPNTTVTLNHLHLVNGSAPPDQGGAGGGALYVEDGAVVNLDGDTFDSNQATTDAEGLDTSGGAILNKGTVILYGGNTFTNNYAYENGGAIENLGTLNILNDGYTSNFSNNRAVNDGGAIDSDASSVGNLSIAATTFQNNTAEGGNGGAIYTAIAANLGNSDQFISNKALVNANTGDGGYGGAIYSCADSSDELQDDGSMYQGNSAAVAGGAIDASNLTTITDDSFVSNTSLGDGGALVNEAGTQMTVTDSTFSGNGATNDGGAVENKGNFTVKTENIGTPSKFANNTASNNGGAIDSNTGVGSLQILSTLFYGNHATGGAGGAINSRDNTNLVGDNFGVFSDVPGSNPNNAKEGGGAVQMDTTADNPNVMLTVSGCKFNSNDALAPAGFGGAIDTSAATNVSGSSFLDNSAANGGAIAYQIANGQGDPPIGSSLTVSQSLFQYNGPLANGAPSLGGAIYSFVDTNSGTVAVDINTSTFTENGQSPAGGRATSVEKGGGVDIDHTTSGTAAASTRFTNDTFFNNSSGDHGGAIALDITNTGTGTNNAVLTSLTVNQNKAVTDSGGVYVNAGQPGVVSMNNNIFDGNSVPGFAGAVDVTLSAGTFLNDLGYNLVGTSNNMFAANTDILNNAPGLANALADNNALPGYQQTLALLAGSPALGKGDPKLADTIDERGYTRSAGSVSIGAEDPNALGLMVGQSSTSIKSSGSPALAGQPITFTVAVTAAYGIPTGTVTFYDGSTPLGTVPLDSDGSASFKTAALSLGSHNITASYSGDSTFAGSSESLTQVVSQENSCSVSLSSSAPAPATLNQSVTFTATVSGTSGTPTGSVTFRDADTVLGTAPVDATGKAAFTTSTLSLGSHTIIAVYSGDTTYADSSVALTQQVNQGGTSTSVSADANPAQPGQQVTFTATVAPTNGGTPTGTITFFDGTTELDTVGLALVNGQYQATYTTSSLSSGNHALTAVYSGDDTFGPSSGSMNETIGQSGSTGSSTTLSDSTGMPLLGQNVTFTATVQGFGTTPTGSVTLLDGSDVLATVPLDGNGNASYTTNALSLGNHAIIAVYSGDSTYSASVGSVTPSVVQASSSTSLSSSAPMSAPAGQPVTFTATVSGGFGSPDPTGTVSLYDGTTFLGSALLTLVNGQWQATWTLSTLGLGTHNLIAIYPGDSTFAASEAALTQTITN